MPNRGHASREAHVDQTGAVVEPRTLRALARHIVREVALPRQMNTLRTLFSIGMAISLAACATDGTQEGNDDTTAVARVDGWAAASWGSTWDPTGFDTGWSTTSSTCFLTAVLGDLTRGDFHPYDFRAEASVRAGTNGHWFVHGSGGAYSQDENHHTQYGNEVMAGAACVPYRTSAEGSWQSIDPGFPVTPPKRIADLAPTRRCFLSGILSGGGTFSHYADSVKVVQITRGHTDASHPSVGWYLESTLQSTPYGEPATAHAVCVDFPSIDAEWGVARSAGTSAVTNGTDSGNRVCGLTGIFGAFNVNSYSDGASLLAPTAQNGNWWMMVSTNKFSTADCVE